jgi:CRP/FNR family transcriptional regulator, cyclic AMP receptor protein
VRRFRQDTKLDALKRSPLFEGLSRQQLAQVARLSDDLEVPAGTVLCKEGSRGQEFFVIIDGEAAITRAGERIATRRSGDFFGEIALLEPVKRTATVTAATPLSFFVISEQAFKSVLDTDPAIERKVLRAVARRLVALTGDPTLS